MQDFYRLLSVNSKPSLQLLTNLLIIKEIYFITETSLQGRMESMSPYKKP